MDKKNSLYSYLVVCVQLLTLKDDTALSQNNNATAGRCCAAKLTISHLMSWDVHLRSCTRPADIHTELKAVHYLQTMFTESWNKITSREDDDYQTTRALVPARPRHIVQHKPLLHSSLCSHYQQELQTPRPPSSKWQRQMDPLTQKATPSNNPDWKTRVPGPYRGENKDPLAHNRISRSEMQCTLTGLRWRSSGG